MSDLEFDINYHDVMPAFYQRVLSLYEEEPTPETLEVARELFRLFRNIFPVPPANHFRPIQIEE